VDPWCIATIPSTQLEEEGKKKEKKGASLYTRTQNNSLYVTHTHTHTHTHTLIDPGKKTHRTLHIISMQHIKIRKSFKFKKKDISFRMN